MDETGKRSTENEPEREIHILSPVKLTPSGLVPESVRDSGRHDIKDQLQRIGDVIGFAKGIDTEASDLGPLMSPHLAPTGNGIASLEERGPAASSGRSRRRIASILGYNSWLEAAIVRMTRPLGGAAVPLGRGWVDRGLGAE
jgi:hypothetical protein